MKIRGIEIAIGIQGNPGNKISTLPTYLGVVSLDIDVPAELTKTLWTPLEVQITVLTSTGKFSDVVRILSSECDGNYRVDQNMIIAAAEELARRVNAQRVQLEFESDSRREGPRE